MPAGAAFGAPWRSCPELERVSTLSSTALGQRRTQLAPLQPTSTMPASKAVPEPSKFATEAPSAPVGAAIGKRKRKRAVAAMVHPDRHDASAILLGLHAPKDGKKLKACGALRAYAKHANGHAAKYYALQRGAPAADESAALTYFERLEACNPDVFAVPVERPKHERWDGAGSDDARNGRHIKAFKPRA